MKYNIYVNYNRLLKCYERPLVLQDDDEEYIERVKRDFLASPQDAKLKMAEYLINNVGTYDDNTGVITLNAKNCIFDIGCLLEGAKDGE